MRALDQRSKYTLKIVLANAGRLIAVVRLNADFVATGQGRAVFLDLTLPIIMHQQAENKEVVGFV
jgi:hypothetical protein